MPGSKQNPAEAGSCFCVAGLGGPTDRRRRRDFPRPLAGIAPLTHRSPWPLPGTVAVAIMPVAGIHPLSVVGAPAPAASGVGGSDSERDRYTPPGGAPETPAGIAAPPTGAAPARTADPSDAA